ncbi:UDP-N-acetylmuramate dehydrogenase [Gordonia phosphorivorans]|uniref:UDP-N-acetylenolpyruvoylglucosamine reductase n=1 Tax=Gordonia phosphorivorans TaxID=1056982 RepID=A0ABV6HBC9_9ACTN
MTTTFAELTTMRVGGPADEFVAVRETAELVEVVKHFDAKKVPVLIMGDGSNLVVGDAGFRGAAVQVRTSGVVIDGGRVLADAGALWDSVVVATIESGLGGLEPLSGIPGSTGATPVQNVGAYGALVSTFLTHVTAYDRHDGVVLEIPLNDCGFGSHRKSLFKRNPRYVVLSVGFELPRTGESQPIAYAGLAQRLDVEVGDTVSVAALREAVVAMRTERAMVLNPADHDTWSVGSFFVNPVLHEVPARASECPKYPDVAGTKLPAAWLIENAGFPRGYGADWGNGRVQLSSRHTLAVTNRGGATTSDVMAFAAHIRDGVEEAFGVRLGPECDLINCSFDDPPPTVGI